MTEVLLEVTNCEIDSVVEETLRKVLSKGRTMPCPCSLQKTLSSQKWLLGVQSRESSKNKFLVALFSYLVQVYCVMQLHASTPFLLQILQPVFPNL
jgi:Arginine/serine-rich protein PNISR